MNEFLAAGLFIESETMEAGSSFPTASLSTINDEDVLFVDIILVLKT